MMLGYSMVLAVHRTYNHTVLMERRVLDTLASYFDGLEDPSPVGCLDEICLGTFPWESFVLSPAMLEGKGTGEALEQSPMVRLIEGKGKRRYIIFLF